MGRSAQPREYEADDRATYDWDNWRKRSFRPAAGRGPTHT
jgi:hypothetical protein